MLRRRFRILLLAIALAPGTAEAGTLCGTIRDAVTSLPVARAGVFLRLPTGGYTGLHAASDLIGEFCVLEVPPGTYDLEVRVDDYQVTTVRNVLVTGDVSGVDVTIGDPIPRLLPPWPNPSRGPVTIEFRLEVAGPVHLTIHDVNGRLVHGWASHLKAGPHRQTWDFKDRAALPVASGRYFVRLATRGGVTVRSIQHVR